MGNWGEAHAKKLIRKANLLLFVFYDLLLLVLCLWMLEGSKFIIEEWIYKAPLKDIDNLLFDVLYTVSKIIILLAFLFYAVIDVILETKKLLKEIKNMNE